MVSKFVQRSLVLGLVTLGLFLSGCGSNDDSALVLAPQPSADGGDSIKDAPAAHDRDGDVDSGLIGGIGSLVGGIVRGAVRLVSTLINGATGGEVSNGRYLLRFQPGAFSGQRVITITDLGVNTGEVELGPHGLNFSNRVELRIDLAGTQFDSPRATIEWFDPDSGQWVDMHGTYDPVTHRVTAVLPHFSRYRPRAGW